VNSSLQKSRTQVIPYAGHLRRLGTEGEQLLPTSSVIHMVWPIDQALFFPSPGRQVTGEAPRYGIAYDMRTGLPLWFGPLGKQKTVTTASTLDEP
jgi:hypothetical protein